MDLHLRANACRLGETIVNENNINNEKALPIAEFYDYDIDLDKVFDRGIWIG